MRDTYDIWVRDKSKCGVCLELHLENVGDCAELEFFLRYGIEAAIKKHPHLNTVDPQKLCDKLKEAMDKNSP